MNSFLKGKNSEKASNACDMENWFLLLQSAEHSEDTKWRLLELNP